MASVVMDLLDLAQQQHSATSKLSGKYFLYDQKQTLQTSDMWGVCRNKGTGYCEKLYFNFYSQVYCLAVNNGNVNKYLGACKYESVY